MLFRRWLTVRLAVAVYCSGAVSLLALTACKTPRRTEPIIGEVSYEQSPWLAQGRKAFAQHCHSCHPNGEGGLGPSLNDKPLPGALITYQVRHGLGVMPSFESQHLSDKDLEAIVAYLKDLRQRPPAER